MPRARGIDREKPGPDRPRERRRAPTVTQEPGVPGAGTRPAESAPGEPGVPVPDPGGPPPGDRRRPEPRRRRPGRYLKRR